MIMKELKSALMEALLFFPWNIYKLISFPQTSHWQNTAIISLLLDIMCDGNDIFMLIAPLIVVHI